MASSKKPSPSDEFFVERDFQIRFILKLCLLTLVGGIMFSGVILFFSRGTLTTSFHAARLVVKETSIAVLPAVIYTNLIMLSIALLAAIAATFFLVRKITMPLFRLKNTIKAIGEGDLTTTNGHRAQDQTSLLAQNINMMTKSLNSKIHDLQSGLQEIIKSASNKEVPEFFAIDLIRLHQRIGRIFKI